MNQRKKYNRIKYIGEQQDGEGLFDIFESTGKTLHRLQLQSCLKNSPKQLLQQALKSLLRLVRKLSAKVLRTKL